MSAIAPPIAVRSSPRSALPWAATAWWTVAVLGQMMFAAYVVLSYGRAAASGHLADWNKVIPHGWDPAQPWRNAIVASHLLLTVVVVVGGLVQLLPPVRRVAPALHRWNGRIYIVSALIVAAGGLTLMATRRADADGGDLSQRLGIGLNALLMAAFAACAWRDALARRFDRHRRWALRLWLAASGVWFFRIGVMAWILANRGPAGFDPKTFTGPFLTFLSFAQTLLPLALLELYFRVRDSGSPAARLTLAGGLLIATLLTALGIVGASMALWLPHMKG